MEQPTAVSTRHSCCGTKTRLGAVGARRVSSRGRGAVVVQDAVGGAACVCASRCGMRHALDAARHPPNSLPTCRSSNEAMGLLPTSRMRSRGCAASSPGSARSWLWFSRSSCSAAQPLQRQRMRQVGAGIGRRRAARHLSAHHPQPSSHPQARPPASLERAPQLRQRVVAQRHFLQLGGARGPGSQRGHRVMAEDQSVQLLALVQACSRWAWEGTRA